MTKCSLLQIGATLGIAALFIGIPRLLKSTPASLINLPNKSYWLAPERREETMDRLASSFEALGMAHGTHVGVMLHTDMHYPVTWLALATIGADGPNGAYMHMGETLPW